MSTKASTVEYIEDQLVNVGVTSRKMFGVRRGWGPVARPEQLGCEAGSRKIAVAIYV